MQNLNKRLDAIARQIRAQELGDAERAEGWQRLIAAGNPRALELYEIAKQRRDAAQRASDETSQAA